MPVFDLIIPLGLNCAAASQCRFRNLRLASFPFDWALAPDDHPDPISLPLYALETRFANWFVYENLKKVEDQRFEGSVAVQDLASGYIFLHDFHHSPLVVRDVERVREKYIRRIDRMYQMIEKASSILFVIYVQDNKISMARLREARTHLQRIFHGKQLSIYAITLSASSTFEETYPPIEYPPPGNPVAPYANSG